MDKTKLWVCPMCSTPLGDLGGMGFSAYGHLRVLAATNTPNNVQCKECETTLTLRLTPMESDDDTAVIPPERVAFTTYPLIAGEEAPN